MNILLLQNTPVCVHIICVHQIFVFTCSYAVLNSWSYEVASGLHKSLKIFFDYKDFHLHFLIAEHLHWPIAALHTMLQVLKLLFPDWSIAAA